MNITFPFKNRYFPRKFTKSASTRGDPKMRCGSVQTQIISWSIYLSVHLSTIYLFIYYIYYINIYAIIQICYYINMYALNLFIEHSGEHWWQQYIFFCLFTKSILAKLSTWCFEHSGDISCSLLVNPSHTDESWAGQNRCMWINIYLYMYKRNDK